MLNIYSFIENWIYQNNKEKGYLPGLSPQFKIANLADMTRECTTCANPSGNCIWGHIMRNMVATELLIELVGDVSPEIKKQYLDYLYLKEFLNLHCKGQWHKK